MKAFMKHIEYITPDFKISAYHLIIYLPTFLHTNTSIYLSFCLCIYPFITLTHSTVHYLSLYSLSHTGLFYFNNLEQLDYPQCAFGPAVFEICVSCGYEQILKINILKKTETLMICEK